MNKALIAVLAAGSVATATVAIPSKAEAYPAWVVPAIIGAGVGGLVLGGAAVAANNPPYYGYSGPAYGGNVYVRPSAAPARCYIARERVRGGWRKVQVCD
jgi:hypothetical protein